MTNGNHAPDPFEYQPPSDEQTARIKTLRQHTRDLRDHIVNLVPPSRELSLALTKLEECNMWTNKGIVMNGSRPEPHP